MFRIVRGLVPPCLYPPACILHFPKVQSSPCFVRCAASTSAAPRPPPRLNLPVLRWGYAPLSIGHAPLSVVRFEGVVVAGVFSAHVMCFIVILADPRDAAAQRRAGLPRHRWGALSQAYTIQGSCPGAWRAVFVLAAAGFATHVRILRHALPYRPGGWSEVCLTDVMQLGCSSSFRC